ncbi:UNVERIFIED_ORG: hypothetical protein GGE64_004989 [Rhizobium etli]
MIFCVSCVQKKLLPTDLFNGSQYTLGGERHVNGALHLASGLRPTLVTLSTPGSGGLLKLPINKQYYFVR